MANNNVVTGGRARFMINGIKIGYAMGVDVTETISQEAIKVLDDIRTKEFATTSYDCQVNCQIFRVPNEGLASIGLWPLHDPTPEGFKRLLLGFGDLTADIYDSISDTFITKVYGLAPTTKRESFSPRGVSARNYSFVAIGTSDEATSNM